MASTIILSDNGVSSGSAGLKETGGNDGVLILQTTTSGGTATNALYIDTSQNVGLGVTPTLGKLQVQGNVYSSGSYILANDGYLYWGAGDGSCSIQGNSSTEYIAFKTTGTEAMRINSAGVVMVGGTYAPYADANRGYINLNGATDTVLGFSVGGTAKGYLQATSSVMTVGAAASSAIAFNLSGERARFDSGGNFTIGTTDISGTSGAGFKVTGAGTLVSTVASFTTSANSSYLMYSTGAAAYRFYVGWEGTIRATSTTITGISDQRLKENVRDLDDGLEKVMALQPRKFDWKEGKGQDIKNARGFIAQEFEAVFPDMVEEWLDPAPEGEEPYKAVNANLIPTLVKAIQEQQALITQLQADVAALKGN